MLDNGNMALAIKGKTKNTIPPEQFHNLIKLPYRQNSSTI
jgi:hypothetical protein